MRDNFTTELKYLRNVSPKTLELYGHSFQAFPEDDRPSVLKRIAEMRDRGVKPVSVNTYLRCLNAYFMWLHKEHGKERVRIPKLKEEQTVLATLTSNDVTRIISFKAASGANQRRAHLVALTILDTGMRISEVLGLTKDNVDLDNLILKIRGKGGKERLVPFSPELRKMLFRQVFQIKSGVPPTVSSLLFGTKNNTKLTVRNLNRDFKVLGQKLGITGVRFSPHTLRHTFAIQSLRNGLDLFTLSRILGHSSIVITQIYLRSIGIEQISEAHRKFSPLSALQRNGR